MSVPIISPIFTSIPRGASVPLTATVLLTAACYSTACYAIAKGCEYLCTRPARSEGRVQTVFGKFRESCADFKENIAKTVGEQNWSIFSDAVSKYAWISTFVVSILLLIIPLGFTKVIENVALGHTLVAITLYVMHKIEQIWMRIFPSAQIVPSSQNGRPVFQFSEDIYNMLNSQIELIGRLQAANTGLEDPLNLLALNAIPVELHVDRIFRESICPLTHCPIRHPVGDPDGITIYERNAVEDVIRRQGLSPTTQQPLQVEQLLVKRELADRINSRLQYHMQCLRLIVQAELNV